MTLPYPDRFEHPPQEVGPRDAHDREHRAHLQVLRQRRAQAENREDQGLRDDRDIAANRHVRDVLDQRDGTALLHDPPITPVETRELTVSDPLFGLSVDRTGFYGHLS